MTILTPQDVANYWTDEQGRIDDEVARIMALLKEPAPGTGKPKHFNGRTFRFPLTREADIELMKKVAAKLVAAGWEADVKPEQDIGGRRHVFVMSSPALSVVPGTAESRSPRGL